MLFMSRTLNNIVTTFLPLLYFFILLQSQLFMMNESKEQQNLAVKMCLVGQEKYSLTIVTFEFNIFNVYSASRSFSVCNGGSECSH